MFDEGQRLPSPYHRTKFESERIVRDQPYVPWRVYRPGIVVGDSKTGEMDKIDGPYYFFKAIQRMRHLLPEWVPLVGLDLGYTNVVPVDWVAGALDHIAHEPDLDGRAFHLTDPRPQRVDELINELAAAAHAPRFAVSVDKRADGPGAEVAAGAGDERCRPAVRSSGLALARARDPRGGARAHGAVPRFDTPEASAALAGSALRAAAAAEGLRRPPVGLLGARDGPDLRRGRTLKEALGGSHVLITGASSGIGARPR